MAVVERLILARHGETGWNTRRLVNGDPSVPVGLTDRGREEARRLGEALRDERLDLCATSAFPRTQETAAIALAGRDVPLLVVPELGDPDYGPYEGLGLDEYRAWAASHPSSAVPDGGGESRLAIVRRYVEGFRSLLERPERTVLAVVHALPVAYALAGRDGQAPPPRVPLVENARPYPLDRSEVEAAVALMEDWCAAPTW